MYAPARACGPSEGAVCDHARPSTGPDAGITVCLADGSARTVSPGVSVATWWAACTPQGNDLPGPEW
jgi:hypothetical protein